MVGTRAPTAAGEQRLCKHLLALMLDGLERRTFTPPADDVHAAPAAAVSATARAAYTAVTSTRSAPWNAVAKPSKKLARRECVCGWNTTMSLLPSYRCLSACRVARTCAPRTPRDTNVNTEATQAVPTQGCYRALLVLR